MNNFNIILSILVCCASELKAEHIETDIVELKREIAKINGVIETQQLTIHALQDTVRAQTSFMRAMERGFMKGSLSQDTNRRATRRNISKYQAYSVYGCLSDTLTLMCDEGSIDVTYGLYGEYSESCSGCCEPNLELDCTETIEENRPQDWYAIQAMCNNQTTCEFVYQGSSLPNCSGEIAHYQYVAFDCLIPEPPVSPAYFTAFANDSKGYGQDELVEFPALVSNIGHFYDPSRSIFTCPYNGLYMFSVNVVSTNGDTMVAKIVMDSGIGVTGDVVITARASSILQAQNQASNMAFVECDAGDRVWVESAERTSRLYATNDRESSFSGALIEMYEEP